MSRRKPRTGGIGLFRFTASGVEVEEIRDNPLRRICRYCGAGVGEPCTRPTRHGRVAIRGYHDTRTRDEETG